MLSLKQSEENPNWVDLRRGWSSELAYYPFSSKGNTVVRVVVLLLTLLSFWLNTMLKLELQLTARILEIFAKYYIQQSNKMISFRAWFATVLQQWQPYPLSNRYENTNNKTIRTRKELCMHLNYANVNRSISFSIFWDKAEHQTITLDRYGIYFVNLCNSFDFLFPCKGNQSRNSPRWETLDFMSSQQYMSV